MNIGLHDTVTRADGLAQRLFEERMLVITAKNSMLHRLNEVGTFLWQLLEQPATVASLCRGVREYFEGFGEAQRRDILEFLRDLERRGLIRIESHDKGA